MTIFFEILGGVLLIAGIAGWILERRLRSAHHYLWPIGP